MCRWGSESRGGKSAMRGCSYSKGTEMLKGSDVEAQQAGWHDLTCVLWNLLWYVVVNFGD